MDSMVSNIKTYCRIDYDDDEEVILIMIEAVFEKLKELIPGFSPYDMTSRQKLLVMGFVKDQYDNTEVYNDSEKKWSPAFSSMLLSEMYKGGAT